MFYPGATCSASLRTCPWLSYFAPSALRLALWLLYSAPSALRLAPWLSYFAPSALRLAPGYHIPRPRPCAHFRFEAKPLSTANMNRARNYADVRQAARKLRLVLLSAVLLIIHTTPAVAQAGGHTLFGDLKVDETKVDGVVPLRFEVILY